MDTILVLAVFIFAEMWSNCETITFVNIDYNRTLGNESSHFHFMKRENSTSMPKSSTVKKWQIGRVSRRQYEIVNLLWRKTKIFGDIIDITPDYCTFNKLGRDKDMITKSEVESQSYPELQTKRNILHPTYPPTKSVIEFYYMDDFDKNYSISQEVQPNYKMSSIITTQPTKTIIEKHLADVNNETLIPLHSSIAPDTTKKFNNKIKFFESYDTDTPIPLWNYHYRTKSDDENKKVKKENDVQTQTLLEHIDDTHDANKFTHVVKHVKKSAANYSIESILTNNNNITKENLESATLKYQQYNTSFFFEKYQFKSISNISKVASWTDYPYMSVYVNEPYKVHCEAAAISFHWLIASASCLSQRNKDSTSKLQSAYVAYCGANWKHPDRIAYVKSSVVHPQYNPKDKIRKHLYNIGLIQVSNSMASACSGWSKIELMSYHFSADQEGSMVSAVGWGIDRFGPKYENNLSVYESLIYSDSCPGNIYLSREKRLGSEIAKNVYCLILPPYPGEAKDPVHGSFLLVSEKLIAVYLQEERRLWGEQSAVYTGFWNLIPWIHEIAKEPDEIEFLSLDF